jgi:hypothetical protein
MDKKLFETDPRGYALELVDMEYGPKIFCFVRLSI